MFDRIFVPDEFRAAVSDEAWLRAMLDAERALAVAEATAGVIPADAAEEIAAACAEPFDADAIAASGRSAGNPAEPLVRALRAAVGAGAQYVHWGATSQDIVDTAAMLVAARTLRLLADRLGALADACARLAESHRDTPIAARTLLQQAVPTTFGAKAATWLSGVLDAAEGVRALELPAQLGGAAGTLEPLGESAQRVVALFAEELELAAPAIPWHAVRTPVARVASALDIAAGVAGKIALDVALLSQTEVGEAREGEGGASSTMPHKRNPARSTVVLACARLAHANAASLLGGLAQEHERAIGGWQAEWPALTHALAYAGGAVSGAADVVGGLELDEAAMSANLERNGRAVLSERVAFLLRERIDADEARERVAAAAARASANGTTLRAELAHDGLELPDEAFELEASVGSAPAFVDVVLRRYRNEVGVPS